MKASKIKNFAALLSVISLAGACILHSPATEPLPEEPEIPIEEPSDPKDTLARTLIFRAAEWPVSTLDLFLYTHCLQEHLSIKDSANVLLHLERGVSYRIIAIANIRGRFNDAALAHYDAWQTFETSLSDEDPAKPVMCTALDLSSEAGDTALVELAPMLCTIQIRSVTQYISDETLIENPRVFLTGCSTRVRPFGEGRIAPLDQQDTAPVFLPCDIGLYSQYPGTCLYAYPNEVPETATSPATELVMEYELNGKTREYRKALHPLERGCWEPVDIELR